MLQKLKLFVEENQKSIIQISGAIVGAVVGVVVTALIVSSSDEVVYQDDLVEE